MPKRKKLRLSYRKGRFADGCKRRKTTNAEPEKENGPAGDDGDCPVLQSRISESRTSVESIVPKSAVDLLDNSTGRIPAKGEYFVGSVANSSFVDIDNNDDEDNGPYVAVVDEADKKGDEDLDPLPVPDPDLTVVHPPHLNVADYFDEFVENEFLLNKDFFPDVRLEDNMVPDLQGDTDYEMSPELPLDVIINETIQEDTSLPVAKRTRGISYLNMNPMCLECQHCKARYFAGEANTRKAYTKCCREGSVKLPPLEVFTPELRTLFDGSDPSSKKFRRNIVVYNGCFQFASMKAELRKIPGRGPYVFAIQGKIYHRVGDVVVDQMKDAIFGSVYFLDPTEQANQRMANAVRFQVDRDIIRRLTTELFTCNPFAKSYRHLHEVYEEQKAVCQVTGEPMPEVYIDLQFGEVRDRHDREHDVPEVNEIAAIFRQTEDRPVNPTIRVFARDKKVGLKTFDYKSDLVDSLTFPLLFPRGTFGWRKNLKRQRGSSEVSLCDFYSFRLAYRNEDFAILQRAGKLTQLYVVDAYIKIEANRLDFVRYNQDKIRAMEYDGLADHLANVAVRQESSIGRMIVLPSSVLGSPRDQHQRFQDAMAVVTMCGFPSLFVTMTCNPKSPEIIDNIPQGDDPGNHPLLVCRLFKMKSEEFLRDIFKDQVFGDCRAYLHVIEFQKRGLPHSHNLITLRPEDQVSTPELIDDFISAEIPDPITHPELHALVAQHMIHGPCGILNPNSPCMEAGKCKHKFPKFFSNETRISENGSVHYKRRSGVTMFIKRGNKTIEVDNSWVVPYNPFLLLKYRTHINVDACCSLESIKYLYKYFFKGPDQINANIVTRQNDGVIVHDEVQDYVNGRYVTPMEAAWRILRFEMHKGSHTVHRLPYHLPGKQRVQFVEGMEQEALDKNHTTELLAWFELNKSDENSRKLLYSDIPKYYVFDAKKREWRPRKRRFGSIVTRLYSASPRQREIYYLRVLLLHIRGATSFDDLLTVDDYVCTTFHESCARRFLLADDKEWYRCLEEAIVKDMPGQLRKLFAYILCFCEVDDVRGLWEKFRPHFIQDYVRRGFSEADATVRTLQKIQYVLQVNGLQLSGFGLDDPPPIENDLSQMAADTLACRREADELLAQLNGNQKKVFDRVMAAVQDDNDENRLIYVDGAAGTGKTFLYNTIYTALRGQNVDVITMAWTGLAACLLKDGRTVHSRFQLPVPIVENSTSRLTRNNPQGQIVISAKLIIWDEISMTNRLTFQIVDKTCRFLAQNDKPFGGKCVLVGGDFKQCLPIVVLGDRAKIVSECVKSSPLWQRFETIRLTVNMRTKPDEKVFADWLLRLGNGDLPQFPVGRDRVIALPEGRVVDQLDQLMDVIFPKPLEQLTAARRAILTPFNKDCHEINNKLIGAMDGDLQVFYSIDDIAKDVVGNSADVITAEFLHKLTPSGYPLHNLSLKIGAVLMLLRNLNVADGLCNGTKLILKDMSERLLDCEVLDLDGKPTDKRVLIPRVDIGNRNTQLPFILKRRQFPVRLAYAMTITKSQGQSLDAVGVYLPQPIFNHGQLYVACSRTRTFAGLTFVVDDTKVQGKLFVDQPCTTYTKNVVYVEVLNDRIDSDHCQQIQLADPANQRCVTSPAISLDKAISRMVIGNDNRPSNLQSIIDPVTTIETDRRASPTVFGHHAGFSNLDGVSCYANSILQCLMSLKEFRLSVNKLDTVLNQDICELMRGQTTSLSVRERLGSRFALPEQQDAHEFLLALLARLDQDFLVHVEHYQLDGYVYCKTCREPFNLELGLPATNLTVTFPDIRTDFISFNEIMSGVPTEENRFCGGCNQNLWRKTLLTACRTYLIVHLARYQMVNGHAVKITTRILDFNPDCVIIDQFPFQVVGYIVHEGQHVSAGHYWAMVREGNDWTKYNDENVSRGRFDDTLTDVVLLFLRVR